MKQLSLLFLCALYTTVLGCGGSRETIMPDGKLTDEQNAAVAAEDKAIEEEEGARQ